MCLRLFLFEGLPCTLHCIMGGLLSSWLLWNVAFVLQGDWDVHREKEGLCEGVEEKSGSPSLTFPSFVCV